MFALSLSLCYTRSILNALVPWVRRAFIVVKLTEEGKEARRQYHQEYRRKKREEKRKADIRYWNKKGRGLDDEISEQKEGVH